MGDTRYQLFLVVPPGLEAVAAWELGSLGIQGRRVPGGVAFSGGLKELYRVNLWSRTGSRVLVRLARFHALSFLELEKRLVRLPWEIYFNPGVPLRIRVTLRRSRLYHTGAVEERIRRAVTERLGVVPPPPEEGRGHGLIVCRLHRDRCLMSVDSSGEHLHHRYPRPFQGKAPIRENLAAALLMASGWTRRAPLLDPFCGSGTIAIEAALMALNRAPGILRHFAFERWRNFRQDQWEEELAEARGGELPEEVPAIVAMDRSPEAVEGAIANAEAAGVGRWVKVEVGDATDPPQPPGGPGWICTNPPYGRRLDGGKADLYRKMGRGWRRLRGWWVTILCGSHRRCGGLGFRLYPLLAFSNGGIRVTALGGRIP